MGQIIGNKSEGHNYHYANLADIARQGIELPPMRVVPLTDSNGVIQTDGNGNPIEYVEAKLPRTILPLDVVPKGSNIEPFEWVRGARIVIPSNSRSNEAQNYGAALTYARRYTVLTLLGIACDDDDKIESHSESDQKANENAALEELKTLYEKAGGKDFDKWVESCGGFSNKTYPAMKTKLIKQINANAEKGDKN